MPCLKELAATTADLSQELAIMDCGLLSPAAALLERAASRFPLFSSVPFGGGFGGHQAGFMGGIGGAQNSVLGWRGQLLEGYRGGRRVGGMLVHDMSAVGAGGTSSSAALAASASLGGVGATERGGGSSGGGVRLTLAPARCGLLMTFGKGDHGKLGHGPCQHAHCADNNCTENKRVPTLVEALAHEPVMKIDSLSTHSVAVTTDGRLFTWGNGDKNRLGHGSTAKEYAPMLVQAMRDKPAVRDVSCGLGHTLALVESGLVYAWGNGGNGRLGLGDNNDRTTACLVPSLTVGAWARSFGEDGREREGVRVAGVFTGASHSLVVTVEGVALTWGKNNQGQCGHGMTTDQNLPRVVQGLLTDPDEPSGGDGVGAGDGGQGGTQAGGGHPLVIVHIAGGWEHTLLLSDGGELFSCGSGYKDSRRSGLPPVLGHGGTERELVPRRIMALRDHVIVHAACGWDHSLAVTNMGLLYSWGAGTNGKLGHNDEAPRALPTLVEALAPLHPPSAELQTASLTPALAYLRRGRGGAVVVQAEAGCEHSAAITLDGELHTWGHGDSGRLGHGDNRTEQSPRQVKALSGCPVVSIAVGDKYNLVVIATDLDVDEHHMDHHGSIHQGVQHGMQQGGGDGGPGNMIGMPGQVVGVIDQEQQPGGANGGQSGAGAAGGSSGGVGGVGGVGGTSDPMATMGDGTVSGDGAVGGNNVAADSPTESGSHLSNGSGETDDAFYDSELDERRGESSSIDAESLLALPLFAVPGSDMEPQRRGVACVTVLLHLCRLATAHHREWRRLRGRPEGLFGGMGGGGGEGGGGGMFGGGNWAAHPSGHAEAQWQMMAAAGGGHNHLLLALSSTPHMAYLPSHLNPMSRGHGYSSYAGGGGVGGMGDGGGLGGRRMLPGSTTTASDPHAQSDATPLNHRLYCVEPTEQTFVRPLN